MNMDRNTVIGMVLLAALFLCFCIPTGSNKSLAIEQQRIADSTKKPITQKITPAQKAAAYADSPKEEILPPK